MKLSDFMLRLLFVMLILFMCCKSCKLEVNVKHDGATETLTVQMKEVTNG